MKLARYEHGGSIRYGALEGETLRPLAASPYESLALADEPPVALADVRLLTPVTPGKMLAVGFNYRDHAIEFNKPIPTVPNIFIKPDSCLTGPDEPVLLPPCYTQRVEHESELVVVIGKRARFVSEADALSYVLGYTCGNDVTARDMQSKDNQWSVCKGFDTFGPVGPIIETDADPTDLDILMRVNGEVRQRSNTRHLIFSVAYLVHYLSHCMTLNPGDVIFTGTTSGVSPVHEGDVMEVVIPAIGTLKNPVKKG